MIPSKKKNVIKSCCKCFSFQNRKKYGYKKHQELIVYGKELEDIQIFMKEFFVMSEKLNFKKNEFATIPRIDCPCLEHHFDPGQWPDGIIPKDLPSIVLLTEEMSKSKNAVFSNSNQS